VLAEGTHRGPIKRREGSDLRILRATSVAGCRFSKVTLNSADSRNLHEAVLRVRGAQESEAGREGNVGTCPESHLVRRAGSNRPARGENKAEPRAIDFPKGKIRFHQAWEIWTLLSR